MIDLRQSLVSLQAKEKIMALSKVKIDVVNKSQSNPFNWRGQFTPDLVDYLLEEYGHSGNYVADPFSGSGTVLLSAAKHNMPCLGIDVNPSAYYMSKFYEYSMLPHKEREVLMQNVRNLFGKKVMALPDNMPIYTANADYRTAYGNLLDFARMVKRTASPELLPFMVNVLFLCEKDKKLSIKESLIKNINRIKSYLFALPYSKYPVKAYLGDARSIAQMSSRKIDLIVSSPPYINVFNYHQNYRGIIECFDYDILNVANSEIGSNRKHRSNRYKTVVQYAIDMGHMMYNACKVLNSGGRIVLVVGHESNVRKTPFFNSAIISELVNKIDGMRIEDSNQRHFFNRFGEDIKEDIITIKKDYDTTSPLNINAFENVGMSQLMYACKYATEDNKEGLMSVINHIEEVFESPILTNQL